MKTALLVRRRRGGGFNPLRLFANSEPGGWFEANDSTTLFTDVAGTTPVTAPGDAVALQLDKSQQSSFEARRNLLTYTEQFDNAVWSKSNVTVTANAAAAPDGTMTADKVINTGDTGGKLLYQQGVSSSQTTVSVFAKAAEFTRLRINELGGNRFSANFDLSAETATLTVGANGIDARIVSVGDGWYRCEIEHNATAAANSIVGYPASAETTAGNPNYDADDVSGIYIWGAQAEEGSTATTYQAIGASLPVSWEGNHRTQATTAARPLYALHPVGGVRNLLEYTEEFDNAAWGVFAGAAKVGPAPIFAPNGSTAYEVSFGSTGGDIAAASALFQAVSLSSGAHLFGIYVRAKSGSTSIRLSGYSSFSIGTSDITVTDSDWTFIPFGFTYSSGSPNVAIRNNVAGNSTNVYVAQAQLEEGSTATNYQRVGSFLDVSEEGKARRGRIWYNGTSHFMETGTITPGTDKVQVFAGVRKLSDAAGMVAELSLNWATQPGTLSLQTGTQTGSAGSLYYYSSARGNAAATTTQGGEWQTADVSPDTAVLTGTHDIAGDLSTIRRNGVAGLAGTADKGTGNYLAYPLYFGARGGTTLFFNGYEDTSIIRFGPNLDDTTISKVESYVASKTPESTL